MKRSASETGPSFPGDSDGFNYSDEEIIIVDGPGDTTVRPVPPERRAELEALRAKIAYWEAYRKEQAAKNQPGGEAEPEVK